MAVSNERSLSEVISEKFRLDAEFYQPRYYELIAAIRQQDSEAILSDYAKPTRRRFSPVDGEGFRYIEISRVSPQDGAIATIDVLGEEASSRAQYIVKSGDVLVSTVRPERGAITLVGDEFDDCVCSNGFEVLTPRNNAIAPEYLFAYLKAFQIIELLARRTTATMYPAVSQDDILGLPFFIAPKPIYNVIVADVKLAKQKRFDSIALYAEAEALLLSELRLDTLDLSHQLCYEANHSDAQNAERLDAEYYQPHIIRLLDYLKDRNGEPIRNFATVLSGYAWKSEYFRESTEEGEPFIRIRDCKPGIIDASMLSRLDREYVTKEKAIKAKSGDLTIGMDGLDYFQAAMVDEPCYVNQRVCHVSMPPEGTAFPPEYVMLVINSIFGQAHLLHEMTIAQTVGHITNEDVRDLIVPKIDSIGEITNMIRRSHAARQEAKTLLENAKRRVETLITGNTAP